MNEPEEKPQWITVMGPHCTVCEEQSVVRVKEADYEAWNTRKLFIQEAFPYLSADERELLVSGTHSSCWDTLFDAEEEA